MSENAFTLVEKPTSLNPRAWDTLTNSFRGVPNLTFEEVKELADNWPELTTDEKLDYAKNLFLYEYDLFCQNHKPAAEYVARQERIKNGPNIYNLSEELSRLDKATGELRRLNVANSEVQQAEA